MVAITTNVQYSGTCKGCQAYRLSLGVMPSDHEIIHTAQPAFDAMHQAHHSRVHTTSRREYFMLLMESDDALSKLPRLRQLYYDLALPVLAVGIASTARAFNAPPKPKPKPVGDDQCVCGCGGAVPNNSLFVPGHDRRFLSWVRRIERGGMLITDLSIPERAREAMTVLPKCVCCGQPVFRGVATTTGWMGQECANGKCSCREREQARISAAERIKNMKHGGMR